MEKWGDSGEKGRCQTHMPAAGFDGKEVFKFFFPLYAVYALSPTPSLWSGNYSYKGLQFLGYTLIFLFTMIKKKKEKRVNRDTYLPVASGSQGRKPFSRQ